MEENRIKTNLVDWINSRDLPVKAVFISGIGRCLIATRNISKGSLLVSSESYGTVLEKGNDERCPTCYENIDSVSDLIKCDTCHKPYFCSTKCKSENAKYHNIICDNVEDIDNLRLNRLMYPGIDWLFKMKSKYGPQYITFFFSSFFLHIIEEFLIIHLNMIQPLLN